MKKLIHKANLWDLHVHTPYYSSKSINNYNRDDSEDFCRKICNIIKDSKYGLDMISFTDHNHFNIECYQKFEEARKEININTVLLPGVEIDIYLNRDDTNYKHLIFYFDQSEDYEVLGSFLNSYFKKMKNNKIFLDDFINTLFEAKYKFAISPHSIKQDKRGIVYDWVDEDKNTQRIKIYSGLFFVFWEASKSEIVNAREYIETYAVDISEETAIVSFSDSTTYKEFDNYINNPVMFFRSLNNFRGLQMVGTEPTRLTEEQIALSRDKKHKIIGEVNIQNSVLEFSENLNVIIGGRGKGKSILLESIAKKFNCTKEIFNDGKNYTRSRRNFIDSIDITVNNKTGIELKDDFNIDFINQQFINNLFKEDNSEQLKKYFKNEINSIHLDSLQSRKSAVINKLGKNISERLLPQENIGTIHSSLIDLNDQKEIVLPERIIADKNVNLSFIHDGIKNNISSIVIDFLEKRIQVNEKIRDILNSLEKEYIKVYFKEQFSNIYETIIQEQMYLAIQEHNDNKTSMSQEKAQARKDLKTVIEKNYKDYMNKIKILNKLYEVEKDLTELKIKSENHQGYNKNQFYFTHITTLEHPVEFMCRTLLESFNGNKIKNKESLTDKDKILYFVFGCERNNFDIYNQGTDDVGLSKIFIEDYDPLTLDQIYIYHYQTEKNTLINLFDESPGTQTNSIMEFLFHKDSTVPLLIDQPEDNVDNEARYNDLTRWIITSKFKRQIILVSHDANIVINGDAENLVNANYDIKNKLFTYKYGALEYSNNLDTAANILDGGITAIKRRSKKYGI